MKYIEHKQNAMLGLFIAWRHILVGIEHGLKLLQLANY